jgi:hypothetical protein
MLSSDEHPGIFTFLVGMIVLVMAAVGLSILMDKRFEFSNGMGALQRDVRQEATELAELKTDYEYNAARLAASAPKLQADFQAQKDTAGRISALRQRKELLMRNRADLQASVTSLDRKFADYRGVYRRKVWSAAVGEKLGDLTLQSGKVYVNAIISRVTDVGLEIQHESGIARIQGPDLDQKLQDRFQWDDDERTSRLKQENDIQNSKPEDVAGADAAPAPVMPSRVNGKPVVSSKVAVVDEEKLRLLRRQVSGWKLKVGTLSNDREEASSRSGSRTSVPGSLETWEARAARLGRELAKARTELQVSKSQLADVSPRDPLLRPDPEQ